VRVRIIGLGTNWWAAHSRDLNDPFCFRRNAAWFNSAGLKYGRRLRMCWAFPGQIRFNLTSNFDPDRPLRSIGRTFECSGPNFFDGRIHLLFVFLPTTILPIAIWSHSTSARMGTFRSQPAHGDQTGFSPSRSVFAAPGTKRWC
jgi:hypothetical protein